MGNHESCIEWGDAFCRHAHDHEKPDPTPLPELFPVEQGELLACPFCTMPALRVAFIRATDDCKWWQVECINCGTHGPHSEISEAEAIAAWNTRASDPLRVKAQALIDKLAEVDSFMGDRAHWYADALEALRSELGRKP